MTLSVCRVHLCSVGLLSMVLLSGSTDLFAIVAVAASECVKWAHIQVVQVSCRLPSCNFPLRLVFCLSTPVYL